MRSLLIGGTFDSAKISGSKVREEGEAEGRRKRGRFACCFFRCVAFDAPVKKIFADKDGKKTDFKVPVFVIQE